MPAQIRSYEGGMRLWGRQIPNEELKDDLLPPPGADWSVLVLFAGTLSGYEELKDPDPIQRLQEFANATMDRWRATGELPTDLTQLRIALVAEQRRDHFSDSAADPEVLHYIHALVEAIREQVTAAAVGTGAPGNRDLLAATTSQADVPAISTSRCDKCG